MLEQFAALEAQWRAGGASTAVASAAARAGLAPGDVTGTGPNGTITLRDVGKAARDR
jgi:pyruvate/2-oxoglutarate dehydrogenase complex dihydrolipoamide acyltransferase (E2) component